MPSIEKYEYLVIGRGGAGKFMAWTMAGPMELSAEEIKS